MLINLLMTVIVGGFVGWLASLVMKTRGQMGLLADVVVGIVGSGLGGFLFQFLGLAAYGPIAWLIVSVVGAVVLIALLKGLGVYR